MTATRSARAAAGRLAILRVLALWRTKGVRLRHNEIRDMLPETERPRSPGGMFERLHSLLGAGLVDREVAAVGSFLGWGITERG
jgi:hypothetical protein